MRWSIGRGGGTAVVRATYVVAAAGLLSFAADVRAIRTISRAEPSDLVVRIIPRGSWWELQYQRGETAFVTANELHVPAGMMVSLEWSGLPSPSIDSAICLPRSDDTAGLVTNRAGILEARFVRTWPPGLRRLRIVAERRDEFERWFRHEAQPAAAANGGSLFANAGCAFCHTIRGVAAEAATIAPDLTHFAARATIGAAAIPNRHGTLSGWVAGSRGMKRDSQMPDNRLDPRVLHAVVAYLESLH